MYAMDATNPLRLYDCLIPEITAYRPHRILYDEMAQNNYVAKLQLKETEYAIVSTNLFYIFSLDVLRRIFLFY